MDYFVLPLLVALTSLAGVLVGARRLGLSPRRLGGAVVRAMETLGLLVLFGVANVALGVVGILAWRGLTGEFVSFYILNDAILGLFSLLQALVFQWWRARTE
jgi:hypothetical protein